MNQAVEQQGEQGAMANTGELAIRVIRGNASVFRRFIDSLILLSRRIKTYYRS